MSGAVTVQFRLNLLGRTLDAQANIPAGPVRLVDILPVLHSCNDAVISAAVAHAEAAVSCRAGCGACCRQMVPIAEPEAFALGAWVAGLSEEQRASIHARFAATLATLERHGVLNRLRSGAELHDPAARRSLGLAYFAAAAPCPFLVDESCSIHAHRPMKCREYLVTSPPANCAVPDPAGIALVPMPVSLFNVLANFGNPEPRWMPLVLALEWYERNKDRPQPVAPGPDLLKAFLTRFAGERP